jgi:hypothetical protein
MKSFRVTLVIFLALAFSFISCKKDNKDSTKPIFSDLEIGLGNSLTFYQGGDMHIEFEASDDEELGYYEVEIHTETKSGGSSWEFSQRWDFDPGLKNALVHQHEIVVPADAAIGEYHFHLTLADKAGNTVSVEEDILIKAPEGGDAPEIHVESAPGEHQVFTAGQTIAISGHVHSETSHIAGMLIAIVRESDNLTNEEVNSTNSIVLVHEHDFEQYEVDFSASIVVGAPSDNNHPTPNPISSWALGDTYILIKAKVENGQWGFSTHYHIEVNGK